MYFLDKKGEALLEALFEKITNYYQGILSSGTLSLWRRCHLQYHAGYYNSGVIHSHNRGSLKKLVVNDFRNLLEHLHILITKEEPTLTVMRDSRYKNISENISENSLVRHYQNQMGLGNAIRQVMLYDILYGSSYLWVDWDLTRGEDFSLNIDGGMQKTGELIFRAKRPVDVVLDLSIKDREEATWYIVRHQMNRYDLMVRYPEDKKKLEKASDDGDSFLHTTIEGYKQHANSDDDDYIWVYTLYHDQTPSVPLGRKIVFTREIILENDSLRAKYLSIIPSTSHSLDGTALGYSIAYDLLSIQNAKDKLLSTILTNQAAFGLQMILNPRGSNIEYKNLSGISIIDYDHTSGAIPSSLDLLKTSPEIFTFVNMLISYLERISGINEILRGSSGANKEISGKALMYVSSLALHYANSYEKSYANLYKLATKTMLSLLKHNLKVEKTYNVIGDNEYQNKPLKAEQLLADYEVNIELSNPLLRTSIGNMAGTAKVDKTASKKQKIVFLRKHS